MNLGLDLLGSEDFLDDAFFVNEIGGTKDSYGLFAAGYLLAPAAEFLQQGSLGISKEETVGPWFRQTSSAVPVCPCSRR